ncbi:MAG: ParB N-terminal domain-containing protein [Oscillospiraceae bacterium]
MRIETKSINDLILADYNPRKDLQPGDPEYEKLKKSILEFDYVEPIIWNQRTGRIVGGHQRLKVLQELGRIEVEVSVVDLPEDKEKALNLALNKISGDWDLPRLKDLLEELNTGAFDMDLTGFDVSELEEVLSQFEDFPEVFDDDFDVAAEVEKIIEPVTKPGDIWLLGRHRVMCGDATVQADIEKLTTSLMVQFGILLTLLLQGRILRLEFSQTL